MVYNPTFVLFEGQRCRELSEAYSGISEGGAGVDPDFSFSLLSRPFSQNFEHLGGGAPPSPPPEYANGSCVFNIHEFIFACMYTPSPHHDVVKVK